MALLWWFDRSRYGAVLRAVGEDELAAQSVGINLTAVKVSAMTIGGAIAARSAPGRYRRGVGMASMLHVGGGAKIYPSDGCGTILKLDDFGHVTLITGASEIGQGSAMKLIGNTFISFMLEGLAESAVLTERAGVPLATTSPPRTPAPGPKSITLIIAPSPNSGRPVNPAARSSAFT